MRHISMQDIPRGANGTQYEFAAPASVLSRPARQDSMSDWYGVLANSPNG